MVELGELEKHYDEFARRNTRVMVVSLEGTDEAEKTKSEFPHLLVAADKGRRLDHVWVAPALADRVAGIEVLKDSRAWRRPSDHVPVTAMLEL